MDRLDRAIALMLSAMIAVFGFLPIANWLPGQDRAPRYSALVADLGTSLFIAVGAGVVLAILSRRMAILWRTGLLSVIQRGAERRWTVWVAGIAGLAMLFYVWVALGLFSGRPLQIDEIIQVFQGRILATGHFWIPIAPHPEFFASLNLVEQGGRVYGQFPMGGPAMLALG